MKDNNLKYFSGDISSYFSLCVIIRKKKLKERGCLCEEVSKCLKKNDDTYLHVHCL
jgi:hypothetical protein